VWLTPHLRDPQPEGERECSTTVPACDGRANKQITQSTFRTTKFNNTILKFKIIQQL